MSKIVSWRQDAEVLEALAEPYVLGATAHDYLVA